MVSPAAVRPCASPVSSGGASGDPPIAPVALTSSPWVMRAAAYDQSSSSEIRSSWFVRAIMSKDAKCRCSWTGVVIPAWWAPKKSYADCAVCRSAARPALTPAANPPAAPATSPAAPAPTARPSSPRRLTPVSGSGATAAAGVSTPGGSSSGWRLSDTLGDHRGRELRQRLGERVDQIGELALVFVGELAVVDESVRKRSVRGEGCLERGVAGVDVCDQRSPVVALRLREVAHERERHLRAFDVGGEVPEVGARPPVLFAADLAGRDLVEQRDRPVAQAC